MKQELSEVELKQRLRKILIAISSFCEKENLQYSLAYGTLLGAVRHKGFIPWDDDIDLMMPRESYEVFIRKFKHKQYEIKTDLADDGYSYPFAKVFDNTTLLIENNTDGNIEIGVYVDIFPIDGAGNNKVIALLHLSRISLLRWSLLVKNAGRNKKNRNFVKQLTLTILKTVISPIKRSAIIKRMCKLSRRYPLESSKYGGNLVWCTNKTKLFPIIFYRQYGTVEFEGNKYKSIAMWDEWLRQTYGEYMCLPPIDKRVSNHGFTAYNIE